MILVDLNYGIILLGDLKIEGIVDYWEFSTSDGTVNVQIDGTWYKTDSTNILLMHKDL